MRDVGVLKSRELWCYCSRSHEQDFENCLLKSYVEPFKVEKVNHTIRVFKSKKVPVPKGGAAVVQAAAAATVCSGGGDMRAAPMEWIHALRVRSRGGSVCV